MMPLTDRQTYNTLLFNTPLIIISCYGQADVDLAVKAARRAFHRNSEWRLLNASRRGEILHKFSELVQRDSKYISELESYNNGMTMNMCPLIIDNGIKYIKYYASLADKIQGSTIPAGKFRILFFNIK